MCRDVLPRQRLVPTCTLEVIRIIRAFNVQHSNRRHDSVYRIGDLLNGLRSINIRIESCAIISMRLLMAEWAYDSNLMMLGNIVAADPQSNDADVIIDVVHISQSVLQNWVDFVRVL